MKTSPVILLANVTACAAIFAWSCASSPPTEPSITEKKAAAEGSYGAQLQDCVQKTSTAAGADLCAAGVRARWAKDAGVEGGAK